MKKGRITTIVLFSVLAALLLILFIFIVTGEKRYQWYESYNVDSDQPYGTRFIEKMMEDYHPKGDFTMNKKRSLQYLLDSAGDLSNTNYIFIGQNLYLTDQDMKALLHFMQAGNDAFISSSLLPEQLLNRVYVNECNQYLTLQAGEPGDATMNFYHDTLRTKRGYTYKYRVGSEDIPYFWNSLNSGIFCDSTKSLTPLGYQRPDKVNFIKFKYGKGNLYLHTNPIVFTNYFMTHTDKVNYASGVFSHLKGENIIWDEFSKTPFVGDNNSYNSPLYFILQQPALKYAWWMLLITIFLYAYFAAKRTQRVIPVLETKANTSLEFVRLISSLHYQNANHFDIAKKKMKYFQYFVRARYGIQTQLPKEEQLIKLAEKSKVNLNEIQLIFNLYKNIEASSYYNIDAHRLADLYYALNNFYKHCK